MKKEDGIQTDLFGQPVHILNAKEVYRMVKCGECGNTVKASEAKMHLSFGKKLNICNECLIRKGKTYKGKKKQKK